MKPVAKAPAKKAPPAKKAAPSRKLGAPAKVAPTRPAKPTRGPYASDTKFLDEQRALLLEEREVYQRQADDLRAEAESLALDREPGDVQFDEESGEGGTVAVDRERDLTLSAQAMATIDEIDFALVAIDNKLYGACENCGQPIPKARLRALPYARLCVACKSGGLHRR
jgi:DnaK suppressor protein